MSAITRKVKLTVLVAVGVPAWITVAHLLWDAPPVVSAHPPIPEASTGTGQCDSCHSPVGVRPLAATHVGQNTAECTTCHALVTQARSPLSPSYEGCATCHAVPGRSTTLPAGQTVSLSIDIERYVSSIHGRFSCTVCHAKQEQIPHQPLTVEDRRALTREYSEICQSCHRDATQSYEESQHGMSARLGVTRAAACTDCHTAHAVQPAAQWTLEDRAENCATCHTGATAQFAAGWMGHEEPSLHWFPMVFYAEKGLILLMTVALGAGIVHVELDFLRWFWNRVRGKKGE